MAKKDKIFEWILQQNNKEFVTVKEIAKAFNYLPCNLYLPLERLRADGKITMTKIGNVFIIKLVSQKISS